MSIWTSLKDRAQEIIHRARPDTGEIAVSSVQDKYSGYPSNGLTPKRLAAIFREADAGDVLRQMELFEEIEEKDPHLFSQLQTRKNAVTGLDYEIIPFSDDPRDKEIADFVAEELGSLESFEDITLDLLDAIGKGIAVSEIMWGYDGGRVVIKDVKWRHQKRLLWDTDDNLRITTDDHPEGLLLTPNKFIVHRYKARSGHPARAGVLRVVAWMYLFKNYDVKDWLAFCEIFGIPLRLGKYAPGASEDDKRALMEALVKIGTDAAGIIPVGTEIDFVNTEKASSTNLFERLARYCDEQVSKAILGQTLTSDSGGGSYAQSKTHNEVRHDLTAADCRALAATLRRDLIRPLVVYNFGEDRRIPKIRYDCEEAGDLKETAEVCKTLICDIGLPIAENYLYKKFSIPEPGEGETTITPPRAAPLPFKETLVLKDRGGEAVQDQVDRIADAAAEEGEKSFSGVLDPVVKLLDRADSLEEVKELLEDEETVERVLREMDVGALDNLLQRAMTLAYLEGREQTDG